MSVQSLKNFEEKYFISFLNIEAWTLRPTISINLYACYDLSSSWIYSITFLLLRYSLHNFKLSTYLTSRKPVLFSSIIETKISLVRFIISCSFSIYFFLNLSSLLFIWISINIHFWRSVSINSSSCFRVQI